MNNVNIFKTINSDTIKETFEDSYTDYLVDVFENSPNYKLVTKNSGAIEYKTLIAEYDTAKNLVGYKKLVSYPYSTQVFNVGDYVNFIYNGEITNWLIFAIDKQFNYDVCGKIKKCNNILKWKDSNGNILEYNCVIDDKINNSDIDQNKYLNIAEGGIIIYCQLNDDTDTININDRFLFGKQSFKVNAIINYSSPTFLTLIMQKDNIDDNDDFVNQIANNNLHEYTLNIDNDDFTQSVGYTTTLSATVILDDEIVTKNVTWESSDETKAIIDDNGNLELLQTGNVTITCTMEDNDNVYDSIEITIDSVLPVNDETIISPNNSTLYQSQSETYTVYRYIDNIQQSDIFTISSSGVPSNNYSISTTNNSFTITNIKSYTTSALVVTCTNNTTSEITTFSISLKGLW